MPEVLGSWKEIAAYLGKGVRTVQRWEAELGLPVHRPAKARHGIVMAFPAELDRWKAQGHITPGPVSVDGRPARELSHQTRDLASDLLKRSLEIRALAKSLAERCEAVLRKTQTKPPPAVNLRSRS